jgi:hypothetical protein
MNQQRLLWQPAIQPSQVTRVFGLNHGLDTSLLPCQLIPFLSGAASGNSLEKSSPQFSASYSQISGAGTPGTLQAFWNSSANNADPWAPAAATAASAASVPAATRHECRHSDFCIRLTARSLIISLELKLRSAPDIFLARFSKRETEGPRGRRESVIAHARESGRNGTSSKAREPAGGERDGEGVGKS